MIKCLTLGQLDTNCYLVWSQKTRQVIIVDPADSGEFISEFILENFLKPIAVVLTHGHFDHVLGLLALKLNFDLPVFLNPADDFLLAQAQASAKHWLGRSVDPVPPADQALVDGQELVVGEHRLSVIETPGHTPGSVCLWVKNEGESFALTGDTLFHQGVGRTDFSYSSSDQLKKSLQKLKSLVPSGTRCYPGHGPAAFV